MYHFNRQVQYLIGEQKAVPSARDPSAERSGRDTVRRSQHRSYPSQDRSDTSRASHFFLAVVLVLTAAAMMWALLQLLRA
jgi:hypothetical protein